LSAALLARRSTGELRAVVADLARGAAQRILSRQTSHRLRRDSHRRRPLRRRQGPSRSLRRPRLTAGARGLTTGWIRCSNRQISAGSDSKSGSDRSERKIQGAVYSTAVGQQGPQPCLVPVFVNLGGLLQETGQAGEALPILERALGVALS